MGLSVNLAQALNRTLGAATAPQDIPRTSGKVRDMFMLAGGALAIVVTDRVSVFDYKIGTIPYKGQILNQLAAWWFRKLDEIQIPHHLIAVPHPNISLVKHAKPIPIEIVIRAYLTGTTTTSSWYAYQNHNRTICGIQMPANMKKNDQFPELINTPTTKATVGHDMNISKTEILRQGLVSEDIFDKAERYAFKMFRHAEKAAKARGLILVDTKYEMGVTDTGELIVIDEVHTPDSSRYWIRETYESRVSRGLEPESLDKEFVRRMVIDNGYDVESEMDPSLFLTNEIRVSAAEKYIQLYEKMTGALPSIQETSDEEISKILISLNLAAIAQSPAQER